MPRDIMPIMSDRDLSQALADREDAYISGEGTPAWKKQSYGSDLSLLGRDTYLSHLMGGDAGVESPRPGGDPVEKYLPGAEDFMPEYSEQLIEEYPGWRVPYMGDTRAYPEGYKRNEQGNVFYDPNDQKAGEDIGGQTTGYGGYYDQNGQWIGFDYIEPADPGSRQVGNIMGRRPPIYEMDKPGKRILVSGLAGDPQYINGVKQVYLSYKDLVQTYPDMAGIKPEDLAVESVMADDPNTPEDESQGHYFLPEGLWGLYNSIGRADDLNTPRDESVQDLIRYNVEGEEQTLQWTIRDHEKMHGVGQTLMDNAALWNTQVQFIDPVTGEKQSLFNLIAPTKGGHPEWDRELMHIAIHRLAPIARERTRVFNQPKYRNHKFFADILKMDISKDEQNNMIMDRAAALVDALNSAAQMVKGSSMAGSFDYGAGVEGVYGTSRPRVSERQHVEGFEKHGLIGRK